MYVADSLTKFDSSLTGLIWFGGIQSIQNAIHIFKITHISEICKHYNFYYHQHNLTLNLEIIQGHYKKNL